MKRADALALLACLVATAVHLALLSRGHHGDTGVFRDWWLATHARLDALYTRADVNYPVLGALLAMIPGALLGDASPGALLGDASPGALLGDASPGALLGAMSPELAFHRVEKLLLLPWAALFGLALHRAHRALGDDGPAWCASLLLPAGWAGALYFGQLDGVVSALQLTAAWAGTRALVGRDGRAHALGLAALLLSVEVKQLALFAFPVLFVLFVLASFASHTPRRALAATLLSPLVLLLPDLFVALPPGQHLHLVYVLTDAGPPHAQMIGNGPALWSLLGWNADTPSSLTFALGLTPRAVGALLVALFSVTLAALTLRALRRLPGDATSAVDRAAWLIYAAGYLHLGVVTLAAGSHERYCLIAFPLLALGAVRVAPRLLPAIFVVASVCGLYVLSTIEFDAFAFFQPLRHPAFAALFVLPLCIALAWPLVARYGRAA